VFNCSSYTFKLSYSVRVVKCSHKPLKNKREKMTIKSNMGISCSKFRGVIHHSWRPPTPRVPHGYHTWGIADELFLPQIPLLHSSFILRLCNRWYSFIHHSLNHIRYVYGATAPRARYESIPVYTLSLTSKYTRPPPIPNSS
jgi:hypothetical protein